MTKYLIFDSGALINFTINGLLDVFEKLKEYFPGEFLITRTIKHEVIDHPLKVQRFEWAALRVQELLNKGILELAEEKIVNDDELTKEAEKLMGEANNTFFAKNERIHILDRGECECLALSRIISRKGHKNLIVIDERTARVLCESPENLQKLFEKKLHTPVGSDKSKFKLFKEFKIIRSTELAYMAYKKGFIKIKEKDTLEAIIYALKFGGTSISEKEVQVYSRLE